jgi:hypothetical protein
MPLAPGTRLGPYEITAPLGAGGMGEVYRARDTRLDRDVAVKMLPQHLSASSEVRARFEREAKTVSSLNHPHICTLFDLGREGDTDYLVMELVEGEALAQRLEKGALPAAEVLRLGGQITDALDRAHRAGVIHRDLKPGNVMLTKLGANLMDFGLARATGLAGPASGSGVNVAPLSHSPTMAAPLTAEGTILGTFQYMSPEQLEGSEADARSDLWALGCVLYEMATGRRAFEGKSQASLIGSIMGSQPLPLSQLAPLSPPGLERLVEACLAKDPAGRQQSAHDVGMQLAWLAEGGSQAGVPAPVAARRRSRERLAWSLAAAGLFAALVLTWRVVASRSPAPEAIRSLVGLPPDAEISTNQSDIALAPDGRSKSLFSWLTDQGRRVLGSRASCDHDVDGRRRGRHHPPRACGRCRRWRDRAGLRARRHAPADAPGGHRTPCAVSSRGRNPLLGCTSRGPTGPPVRNAAWKERRRGAVTGPVLRGRRHGMLTSSRAASLAGPLPGLRCAPAGVGRQEPPPAQPVRGLRDSRGSRPRPCGQNPCSARDLPRRREFRAAGRRRGLARRSRPLSQRV